MKKIFLKLLIKTKCCNIIFIKLLEIKLHEQYDFTYKILIINICDNRIMNDF